MAKITIDGRSFEGNSVSIVGDSVIIDGVTQDGTLTGKVELHIKGTLQELSTDGSVNMKGKILGNLKAGGSVNCDEVGGNVNAGGSVKCDEVGGSVDARGSVNRR